MIARNLKYVGIMSAAAILMSGCSIAAGLTKQEQAMVTDLAPSKYQPASRETRNNIETQDNFAQAAFWSREYQLNPADLEAAIKLSAAVRKMGNPVKAVEISQTARAMYPRDPYLLAEYAAALIASERGADAIEAIDGGLSTAPGYARLWSLKGAALDQQENYDLARKHYARALQITPQDPNVMSNLGLSYALAGDPVTAEAWMRRAAAQPGAGGNIQQNLNLILQLQGKQVSAEAPQSRTPALRAANVPQQPQYQAQSQPQRQPQYQPQSQPRTYGSAVQAFESRPQQRQPRQNKQQAYNPYQSAPQTTRQAAPQTYASNQAPAAQSPYGQRSTAQPAMTAPSADIGYRSNVTVIGGETGAKSASDMARAAAANSKNRGQTVTVPASAAPPAPAPDIFARLSNSVGPRSTQDQAYAQYQAQMKAQAQYQPQSQASSQPQYQSETIQTQAPQVQQQMGYPAQTTNNSQTYNQAPAPRGAARRR